MPGSKTSVTTASASRYMQQLCKHFSHKVPVEFDTQSARVDFPFGECRMQAGNAELAIECVSETAETLERAQAVIDDHLMRFAWREELEIVWRNRD